MELITILQFLLPIAYIILNNIIINKLFHQKAELEILQLKENLAKIDNNDVLLRLQKIEILLQLILDNKLTKKDNV